MNGFREAEIAAQRARETERRDAREAERAAAAVVPAHLSVHDMTEHDIQRIEQLALHRPDVLNAVCKILGIYLVTTQYTLGQDRWIAKPSDGYEFSGTLAQAGAFVRGYAIAWHSGRVQQRQLVDRAHQFLNDQIEKLR